MTHLNDNALSRALENEIYCRTLIKDPFKQYCSRWFATDSHCSTASKCHRRPSFANIHEIQTTQAYHTIRISIVRFHVAVTSMHTRSILQRMREQARHIINNSSTDPAGTTRVSCSAIQSTAIGSFASHSTECFRVTLLAVDFTGGSTAGSGRCRR